MINASRTQFHVYLPWGQCLFSLNSVLNVKALVGAFNQEKALVGAFSVIVKTGCGTDGSFYSTNLNRFNWMTGGGGRGGAAVWQTCLLSLTTHCSHCSAPHLHGRVCVRAWNEGTQSFCSAWRRPLLVDTISLLKAPTICDKIIHGVDCVDYVLLFHFAVV